MSNNHGGRRPRAGRLPQVFHISKDAARDLSIVTGHKQALHPEITALQTLEQILHNARHEVDQQYQENAEKAYDEE